jgi:hypothetical protein
VEGAGGVANYWSEGDDPMIFQNLSESNVVLWKNTWIVWLDISYANDD